MYSADISTTSHLKLQLHYSASATKDIKHKDEVVCRTCFEFSRFCLAVLFLLQDLSQCRLCSCFHITLLPFLISLCIFFSFLASLLLKCNPFIELLHLVNSQKRYSKQSINKYKIIKKKKSKQPQNTKLPPKKYLQMILSLNKRYLAHFSTIHPTGSNIPASFQRKKICSFFGGSRRIRKRRLIQYLSLQQPRDLNIPSWSW